MARKVFVSSDMAHDEKLIEVAEVCPEAALLWPWFVTYFDDWGRAEAHPKRIKAQLFPMNSLVTPELIEKTLRAYADVGLVILYEINGKAYMAVPPEKWWKYQTHIHKSKREHDQSRYPAPPSADSLDSSRSSAEFRGDARVFVPSPSPSPSPSLSLSNKAAASKEPGYSEESAGAPSETPDVADAARKSIEREFFSTFGGLPPQTVWNDIGDVIERGLTPEHVIEALKRTARQNGQRWSYTLTILNNWARRGLVTMELVHNHDPEGAPARASPQPVGFISAAERARQSMSQEQKGV